MPAWCNPFRSRLLTINLRPFRTFTTRSHDRVEVRCGSSGHVTIDLFNISAHDLDSPLFIHLPPFSSPNGTPPSTLPDFLDGYPVASINYRWEQDNQVYMCQNSSTTPLQWPTPVHDMAFAYAWLKEYLTPEKPARRDVYVYGSFLGASLATSLALTESYAYDRFAVRGLTTYNGVYNWTMFLPTHPIHTIKWEKLGAKSLTKGAHLQKMRESMPGLFTQPANLFDTFASPSLFFHNPALAVPDSFDALFSPFSHMPDKVSLMTSQDKKIYTLLAAARLKAPRKTYIPFPPRSSNLRIPETLLLHDREEVKTVIARKVSRRKGNTFKNQAQELAELMRMNINKDELGERERLGQVMDSWTVEASRRVGVRELGEESESFRLNENGEDEVSEWLEDIIWRKRVINRPLKDDKRPVGEWVEDSASEDVLITQLLDKVRSKKMREESERGCT